MNVIQKITTYFILAILGMAVNLYAHSSIEKVQECAVKYDFSVTDSYKSNDKSPFIIYIEDAHCNYIAQREIARIIRLLVQYGLCDAIAVEGSQGNIVTDLFSTFPVDPVRKNIAENMLKNGIISGEEYLCIYDGTSLPVYGVDDQRLYKENISYFKSFVDFKQDLSSIIDSVKESIFLLKQGTYNHDLVVFDTAYEEYRIGKSDIVNLISHAKTFLPESANISDIYPAIKLACEVITKQNSLSAGSIDTQCKQLISKLIGHHDIDVCDDAHALYAQFLKNTLKLSDYCKQLSILASRAGIDIDQYDAIKQYLWCTDQTTLINLKQVEAELQQIVSDCYRNLCSTDNEKELYQIVLQWHKIERLMNMQLDRNDYIYLLNTDVIADMDNLLNYIEKYNDIKLLTDTQSIALKNILTNNLAFYRIAAQRDDVLSHNTIEYLKRNNADTIVLIAGGFHTNRISEYFSEHEISYAILRPNRIADYNFDRYSSVLLRADISDYFSVLPRKADQHYLRATSFFAEHSFDDMRRVSEFRSAIVFNSIMQSIGQISYDEIFSIVRQWRSAYMHAVAIRHSIESPEFRNALTLFDYLITDLFAYNNVIIDSDNGKIFIPNNGSITTLSQDRNGLSVISVSLDMDKQSRLESSMNLKDKMLFTIYSDVFILAWTIADQSSPNYRHGDAHYSIKYIESLNKRGVSPVVILPDDLNEREETLRKYDFAVSNDRYRFSFAVYDETNNTYIKLDKKMVPLEELNVPTHKTPIVVYLASEIDDKHDTRIVSANDRFTSLYNTELPPVFLRIPTAGTMPQPIENIQTLDIFMNPVARESLPENAIQSGFMADQELLDIIKLFRKQGTASIRKSILEEINESVSGNRFELLINQLAGETLDSIAGRHWTFRYLTEKTEAEMASFMHAAQNYPGSQVVFTFYKDTPTDNRHIEFIKTHASFIDLTREDNNNLDPSRSILVINLPPVDSFMFKTILASSDSAVVSGENSLTEGLVLNKLGIGPSILFKPALPEHMSILTNMLHNTDRNFMVDGLQDYAQLQDIDGQDYFGSFKPADPLTGVSQVIYNTLYDPQISAVMRGAITEAVYEVNGLNALTDIIDDINQKKSFDDIAENHNLSPQVFAKYLMDEFFYDSSVNIHSEQDITRFTTDRIRSFILLYANTMMLNSVPVDLIERRINELKRALMQNYRSKLSALTIGETEHLLTQFQSIIHDSVASVQIIEGGHLFMPVVIDGSLYYRHDYANLKLFVPKNEDQTPVTESEILTPATANRMISKLRDAYYIKRMIDPLYSTVSPFTHYDSELLPPTFNHENKRHVEEIKQYIALAALDYFQNLIRINARFLEQHYGVANTRTLNEYIQAVRVGNMPIDNDLINGYVAFTNQLTSDANTGTTNFFRDVDNWRKEYEKYLSDIIVQKAALGDYTLSIRSVGSAVGKEAYSIASFVEQALLKYARENVYSHITDPIEQTQLVQKWVDRWDVQLFAFDNSVLRLTAAKEGIYLLDEPAVSFLSKNTAHNRLFEAQYQGNGYYPIKRVNKRLRRWMVPVFVDLDKNFELLNKYPAEITFAMNLVNYLKYQSLFVRTLTESTNPDYKAFVAYNIAFNDPPVGHGLLPGQLHVVPPKNAPSVETIERIVTGTRVSSIDNLRNMLGLTEKQFERFAGQTVDVTPKTMFDRIIRDRKNRALVESML
ncbi:MAG: hypothetical protein RBU23_05920 [Candidatus Auribacterota bacterium]|jgi:chemotaxis methyl-accepting protein methylase|nr:hypothetical protein [Candidatus Auribacterota bacterium]